MANGPGPAQRGPVPRIVVTVADPSGQADPGVAARKNALSVDSVVRHGATAIPLDPTTSERDRAAAFAAMDGLLLTGGPDLDPGRYAAASAGTATVDAARDALDEAAWTAADRRGLPVLGLCRGLQAMNVFAGGTLLQHVEGHAGPAYGSGAALTHPMRVLPGTKLARILFPSNVGGGVLTVNSYHHQGVRVSDLAPGFVACGLSPSAAGDLVEALEAATGPFRVGIQSHPERSESTPRQFERLFAFFVDACRGPLRRR
jgi:putative glutamine amidotransferase